MVKTCFEIEDSVYKKELLMWVRSDFKRNKEIKDQVN